MASEAEIKSKYRELSKLYHPDTTSLPEAQAAAKFMELREAYETLSDESKRKYYDWRLTMQVRTHIWRERERERAFEIYILNSRARVCVCVCVCVSIRLFCSA